MTLKVAVWPATTVMLEGWVTLGADSTDDGAAGVAP
jgi:hypothetical protein